MRKPLAFVSAIVLLAFAQCNIKPKSEIEGLWQLQQLEINGTVLTRKMVGEWTWEFKPGDKYVSVMTHMREEGTYTVKDKVLTLKSKTMEQRPEQVMAILRLDSVQLDVKSPDDKNSSSLSFRKVQQ